MVDFTRIPQLARNMNRVIEIVSILVRYQLTDWIAALDSKFAARVSQRVGLPIIEASHEARVRLALTELGTTFIKLGQMLSTRRDLVGPALASELAQLQSAVPSDDFATTQATIEVEFSQNLSDLFRSFQEVPIASASIGQVHRAVLGDGREVVVKVQHPDIAQRIHNDLSILKELAGLASQYIPELQAIRPREVVEEFGKSLIRELDFRRETRHLQIFRGLFAKCSGVYFPQPILDRCTSRVLTMEYLPGTPLSQLNVSAMAMAERERLAREGALLFLEMIFRDGFFHADPHPGNLLVMPDGRIGVLDAGMVGRLDEQLRSQIEHGVSAVLSRDAAALTDVVIQVGSVPSNLDSAGLQTEITEQLAYYWGMPLEQFELSSALNELTDAIRRYKITLPPTMTLLMKVLVMLEGTGRMLHPHFNLTQVLEEYRGKLIRRQLSPKRWLRRLLMGLQDWDDVLQNMPRMLRDLMRAARQQRFALQLQHQHLEPSVNRLVFGLMVSALFVGSAMMWANQAPPEVGGVSVFGALGTFVSVILGYRLFRAIQKTGKLVD